ncbi:MAG TPA: hypothetical protein VFW42_02380 [Fluviicoccus sp.]|nr:hypothetical protein [Fluviicoccus sp.]
MAAATTDRNTKYRDGHDFTFPVKADEVIPSGVMVALLAGVAVNAEADTDLVVVGMSTYPVDNTGGSDGDVRVNVSKQGLRRFFNSAAADAITVQEIGSACYVVDNQTVAKTSATNSRPVAGTIADVDADGVWVKF